MTYILLLTMCACDQIENINTLAIQVSADGMIFTSDRVGEISAFLGMCDRTLSLRVELIFARPARCMQLSPLEEVGQLVKMGALPSGVLTSVVKVLGSSATGCGISRALEIFMTLDHRHGISSLQLRKLSRSAIFD